MISYHIISFAILVVILLPFYPSIFMSPYFFNPVNTELLSDALPDEAEPILNYYEENYSRRRRGNRRRNPRYSHDFWNVYNESLGEEPKTTNSIEGWHRVFSGSLGAGHPNI